MKHGGPGDCVANTKQVGIFVAMEEEVWWVFRLVQRTFILPFFFFVMVSEIETERKKTWEEQMKMKM